jgi:alkylhydroperoxidase family enzyme
VRTAHDDAIERLRVAACPDRAAPAEMKPYLDKVRHDAYRIVDQDVEALLAAGYSEDEIFEQTVSVAVAAGLTRLETALRVLA